ncbi:hypothetical protein [Bizionia sp. M204]|uniref:hypothetical protein n=1 Tax=Bizionia sp. M204 TaxID=2675331 RepID=UPI00206C5A1D|nr:hypothetical protein [Bizionia sp. M204]UPS92435.1 hypothetical protein GMA17_12185 [Bizionia sp. M204]
MSNPDDEGHSTMHRFCSQNVVNLFQKEKIKNINFENLNESTLAIELHQIPLTDKQKSEMEKLDTN